MCKKVIYTFDNQVARLKYAALPESIIQCVLLSVLAEHRVHKENSNKEEH